MLDRQVQSFIHSDCPSQNKKSSFGRSKGSLGAGVKTLGIKVKCRSSLGDEVLENFDEVEEDVESEEENEEDEDNELIWWSWDGKLIGFSD